MNFDLEGHLQHLPQLHFRQISLTWYLLGKRYPIMSLDAHKSLIADLY